MGATVLESISTQDDRLALVAAFRLRAPKARSVSIETLARLARLAPFSRSERLPVEPLVTLVLVGHLAAVRAHPGGGRRMISIVTPGDLVGLLSLGAGDSCCELVGLTAGVAARWPGDPVPDAGGIAEGVAAAPRRGPRRGATLLTGPHRCAPVRPSGGGPP